MGLWYLAEKIIKSQTNNFWKRRGTSELNTYKFIKEKNYLTFFGKKQTIIWGKKQINDFFFRLHNDSWILDTFQRIHSEESKFFIPYDLEISNQELSYIIKRSEQWRGLNGERRKVSWLEVDLHFHCTKDTHSLSIPASC